MNVTTQIRVRSRLDPAELAEREGKVLGDPDYDVLLTGPTRVDLMDGRPLCVYLPRVLRDELEDPAVYEALHEFRKWPTRNRGMASGTVRIRSNQTRSYTKPVPSAVGGAFEDAGQYKYCRQVSRSGHLMPVLQPLLTAIAGHFAEQVPDRYRKQMGQINRTDPAWVIPGTPFTTITVNNTYPTGTHTDKGDLAAGFSTIGCLRRGRYSGGRLVFPEYRVAVDMGHGDLILMDAHEWHGNTAIICDCGDRCDDFCKACGAERISVVSYMREKLTRCGTPAEELKRADASKDRAEQVAIKRLAAKRTS